MNILSENFTNFQIVLLSVFGSLYFIYLVIEHCKDSHPDINDRTTVLESTIVLEYA